MSKDGFEATLRLVQAWSEQRGLNVADPAHQMLKLTEEVGELAAAIARSNQEAAIDAIGDVTVVLTILCQQLSLTLPDCFTAAYDTIKHRQGSTINGVFVKSDDIGAQK